jgi:hypothetical protein
MTINDVFVLCQTIFNKSQNGNITPNQFNNAAPICQISVINELLGNEQEYSPGKPVPRYGFDLNQKIHELLQPIIQVASPALSNVGVAAYPTGCLYIDAIRDTNGSLIYPTEYDEAMILIKSLIRPPRTGHAIYYVFGNNIYVFPYIPFTNVININFIGTPTPPFWNYTETNNVPVYNPTGSQDFQLSPLAHLRICAKILQFFGLNLSVEEVTQYGMVLEREGA